MMLLQESASLPPAGHLALVCRSYPPYLLHHTCPFNSISCLVFSALSGTTCFSHVSLNLRHVALSFTCSPAPETCLTLQPLIIQGSESYLPHPYPLISSSRFSPITIYPLTSVFTQSSHTFASPSHFIAHRFLFVLA